MFEFLKFWKKKVDRSVDTPPNIELSDVDRNRFKALKTQYNLNRSEDKRANTVVKEDDSSSLLSTIVLAELLSSQQNNDQPAAVDNIVPEDGEFSGAGASSSWDKDDSSQQDQSSSSDYSSDSSSSSDNGSSSDS